IALSAVLTVLFLAVGLFWKHRYRAAQAARLTEERLKRGDSLLVNAVEFRSHSGVGGSPVLRSRVVAMAEEFVRDIPVVEVVSPRPAARAALVALGAIAFLGISAALAPRLFGMVVPR